jgi:hypothetical protein
LAGVPRPGPFYALQTFDSHEVRKREGRLAFLLWRCEETGPHRLSLPDAPYGMPKPRVSVES